jgi:hypothetical protein
MCQVAGIHEHGDHPPRLRDLFNDRIPILTDRYVMPRQPADRRATSAIPRARPGLRAGLALTVSAILGRLDGRSTLPRTIRTTGSRPIWRRSA